MLRGLIAMVFMLCAFQALAGETITTIATVVDSLKTKSLLILSSSDGRVYKTAQSDEMKKYLESLKGQSVVLKWTEEGKDLVVTGVEVTRSSQAINFFESDPNRSTEITDVGSEAEVTRLFALQNDGDKSRSQCFKRAHMWAFEMWSREAIVGQKVFIFYSKRYIQLEEFDWWFHVAPVVTAGGVEYVMDKTFLKKPVTVAEWKKKFMKEGITCPIIENYNQYESQPWNRLCFLMKTPMWIFRPLDIRNRDEKGEIKNGWDLMELQDARRAFKGWEDNFEALDTGSRTINH
ncbi:MAG: hypothetical protein K2P81_07570 [Bacteriovoracaceae bacterium]|nr:hypothetical protein [Bacteriovoracaceae bacterium]